MLYYDNSKKILQYSIHVKNGANILSEYASQAALRPVQEIYIKALNEAYIDEGHLAMTIGDFRDGCKKLDKKVLDFIPVEEFTTLIKTSNLRPKLYTSAIHRLALKYRLRAEEFALKFNIDIEQILSIKQGAPVNYSDLHPLKAAFQMNDYELIKATFNADLDSVENETPMTDDEFVARFYKYIVLPDDRKTQFLIFCEGTRSSRAKGVPDHFNYLATFTANGNPYRGSSVKSIAPYALCDGVVETVFRKNQKTIKGKIESERISSVSSDPIYSTFSFDSVNHSITCKACNHSARLPSGDKLFNLLDRAAEVLPITPRSQVPKTIPRHEEHAFIEIPLSIFHRR